MADRSASIGNAAGNQTVDALSRRYHAVLLRYFSRRGIGPQDGQDLAQEVFARLLKAETLGGIINVEAYLFTMAANVLVDHVRRRRTRAENPVEEFYEALQCSDGFSPDRLIEGRQELGCIVAALNEMPERMRNIFILARLEKLPRAEIAQRLGISKSLVEQQITLATACLAAKRRRIT